MQLDVRQVSHSYGSRNVLRDVNVTIPSGTSLAIVGPSGRGKSTLLHIMSGLVAPTSGTVEISSDDGEVFSPDLNSLRNLVAWSPQNGRLLPWRSVVDNVALACMAVAPGWPTATAKALDLLAKFDLDELANKPAKTLSGGEAQRVSIARSIGLSRPFLMIDEPTSQLDQSTGALVMRAISDATVSLRGSVVVATHDPEVASACDEVVSLA